MKPKKFREIYIIAKYFHQRRCKLNNTANRKLFVSIFKNNTEHDFGQSNLSLTPLNQTKQNNENCLVNSVQIHSHILYIDNSYYVKQY